MLSGRGLCDGLITRPEESYRLWRVVVCDLETSKEEAKIPLKGCEYKPTMGCDAEREKNSPVSSTYVIMFFCSPNTFCTVPINPEMDFLCP